VVLIGALEYGLTPKRRQELVEELDIWPQTLSRWRKWWREIFPASRGWQAVVGDFMPPVDVARLPGALLGRLTGESLLRRLCHFLGLLMTVSTSICSGNLKVVIDPQKM
jgi:hypothetical protein